MILLKTGVVIIYIWICHFVTCKGANLFICENEKGNITCPDGKINITRAIYGRTNPNEPCFLENKSGLPNYSCAVPVNITQLECHLQKSCEFKPVNGKDPYPPDPCRNIKKYLNITYTCIIDDYTSTVTETTTDGGTSTLTETTADGGTSALTGTTTDGGIYTLTETTVDGGTSTLTETMASQSCHCPCSAVGSNPWQYLLDLNLTQSEIREAMKPYLASLEKNITIDIKNTSRRQRMITSASDDRKSAKSIGYVGLAIIVTIAFILVSIDFLNIFKSCKRPKRS